MPDPAPLARQPGARHPVREGVGFLAAAAGALLRLIWPSRRRLAEPLDELPLEDARFAPRPPKPPPAR